MHIHQCTPYREDRNLGKAYNDAFSLIPDEDYLCITDYDVLLLLPDTIRHLYAYVNAYPDADMFVCYANRTFATNAQIYGQVSEDADIRNHIKIAKETAKKIPAVTEIKQNVSGFLMLIPKRTWNEIKFTEDMKCLGVDTLFSQKMLNAGKKILRMDGVYVWHTYRLENGVHDKSHLVEQIKL